MMIALTVTGCRSDSSKPEDSGTIDNLTWEFYSDGTLIISGKGTMPDFENKNTRSWDIYIEDIQNVVIENGITNIGNYAFYQAVQLASVTIPNSVTSIGDGVFSGCTELNDVNIPEGVTSIGSNAFYECSSLTSLIIPDSMVSIGEYAFTSCTELPSLAIPQGMTSIENYLFWDCSGLTSVIIPDSITSIGEGAFWGCSNLTDVYYTGSEEQWKTIELLNEEHANQDLLNAAIHYDSTISDIMG